MVTAPPNAYVELNFRPNVQLVSVVRRFVSEFYQRTLNDPDGTSRVALATHELLENAVKYSKDGETTIRIEVDTNQPRLVTILLRNRATDPHITAIREIVDGMAAAKDSFAFYQDLLVQKAKRRDGSGLGLARICAEGEMKITYRVIEGDLVELLANTTVGVTP
ncbi:MAG TPA: ATP-binding protein [Kofleriaceae bacterium]|jgi:anti-sigma regulatory factor (Ser/Thr protein kinase)